MSRKSKCVFQKVFYAVITCLLVIVDIRILPIGVKLFHPTIDPRIHPWQLIGGLLIVPILFLTLAMLTAYCYEKIIEASKNKSNSR